MTYVLGTFYIRFFCTRATISLFRVKPTVHAAGCTTCTLEVRQMHWRIHLVVVYCHLLTRRNVARRIVVRVIGRQE